MGHKPSCFCPFVLEQTVPSFSDMTVHILKGEIQVLLPLFPTIKFTLGPNWNGPRERWHMKFFRVMLSIRPMSPCRHVKRPEVRTEDLQEVWETPTHRGLTDGGRQCPGCCRTWCILGDRSSQSGLLQSRSVTAACSFPLTHSDGSD